MKESDKEKVEKKEMVEKVEEKVVVVVEEEEEEGRRRRGRSLNRYCFLRRRLRVQRRLRGRLGRTARTGRRRRASSFSQEPPLPTLLRFLRSSLDEGQDTRNLHLLEVFAAPSNFSVEPSENSSRAQDQLLFD